MRKKERQLSEEEAYAILGASKEITLSMWDSTENEPYGVIVNAILIGKTLYFHGAQEGRKLDILRSNAHVCITAVSNCAIIEEKYTTAYESIVAYAHAQILTDTKEKVKVLSAICSKFAPTNDFEQTQKIIEKAIDHTAIVALPIERITAKGSNRQRLKKWN